MPENDQNLGWNVDVSDLSAVSLDDVSLENLDIDAVLDNTESTNSGEGSSNAEKSNDESSNQSSSTIDESVFLDAWDSVRPMKNVLKDWDNFWSYLRRFFFAAILTLLWLWAILLLYSFRSYIQEASKANPDPTKQEFIDKYKEKFRKVKDMVWIQNNYTTPVVWEENEEQKVNEIINSTDIDYIEKKDLLAKYASDLVRNAENKAVYAENLKQDIAKQWFLPEELENLLSEDQAIDTIQRSLNALEVIKFSTATKVFSYMNTALLTISEMIRVSWVSIDSLRNLFETLGSRWDKDISAYVYMCYLNPFEVNANCDTIWDLDLYYKLAKDNSIDIRLFKNSMNAINQLLEKWEFSLFSITFNWFNAADKNIQFNIEVYTNQEDEKALMLQGKKNPNIFILTNIINSLKQSSFIIWEKIDPKEIDVDKRTFTQWGISRPVNYSTQGFTVPIQKNTEREIFDYIDLDSMKKLLSDRWFKDDIEKENESEGESIDINNEEYDLNEEIEEIITENWEDDLETEGSIDSNESEDLD